VVLVALVLLLAEVSARVLIRAATTVQCVALAQGVAPQHDAASIVRLMDTHQLYPDRSHEERLWSY
jgi:hypothetical protein